MSTVAPDYTNSKGVGYFCNQIQVKLIRTGKTQTTYYFSRTWREDTWCEIPDNYEVFEAENGLPMLRKRR